MTKLTLQPTEFPMNCPILEGNNFKVILSNILHFKKLRAQGVRNMSTGYEEHNQNQPPHQTWDLGHEAHRGSCLHCQRTTEFKGQAWLPEAWTKNHVRLFFFFFKQRITTSKQCATLGMVSGMIFGANGGSQQNYPALHHHTDVFQHWN